MSEKTPDRRSNSVLSNPVCGQTTTVFVTAAERQSAPRRLASPRPWATSSILFGCLGVGCSTFVTATPINSPPRPLVPRNAESVLVLASTPPTEPHVDVALLQVEQQRGLNRQGTDYMIQRLREKAAELGCDAVFIKNGTEYAGRDAYLDPDAHEMLASCVVFTPPSAAREGETADTQHIQLVPPSGPAQP